MDLAPLNCKLDLQEYKASGVLVVVVVVVAVVVVSSDDERHREGGDASAPTSATKV